MADASADIARCIEDERRHLERNVSELTARASAAIDWREQVRQRPALMVAAALGGGVVLAQLGGRRRPRSAPASDEQTAGAGGALESISGALFAIATGALVTMLSDAIPALRDDRKPTAVPSPNLVVPAPGHAHPSRAASS